MKPDGKLLIEIANELAEAWGLGLDDCKTVTYPLAEVRTWREAPHGLVIVHSEDYEGSAQRTIILWHQILSYEVHSNSDEYIEWKRANGSQSSPGILRRSPGEGVRSSGAA